jgi:hypothetical protein
MNKINNHVEKVCKITQGTDCCRFLSVGAGGFECQKNTEIAEYINSRVARGSYTANGDNCEGKDIKFLNDNRNETGDTL